MFLNPKMGVVRHIHTIKSPPPFTFQCTNPTPLKVKCDKILSDGPATNPSEAFLAPLPSCTALVQLVILLTPHMIVSVCATICIRDLSRFYNTTRTYGQVRLDKATDHFPLVGGYNNFPGPRPSLATI